LDKIRDSKKIEYNEHEYDVIGMMCRYSDKDYIVFVSSLDKSGLAKVNNLRYILIVAILIGLALTSIAAYYYVKQTFKPIELLNTRISIINASNLQQKLEVKKTSDELGMLAENFNRMLDRLADSFEAQKGFVQNASHELRTPLANLTIELDNSLNKTLSIAEYKEILRSIQEDINSLTGIINSLLFLSRYDKLKLETDATLIPIDELLFKSISEVKEYNPSAVVNVDFLEIPEREDFLQIICYPQILQTAFVNLIDNACKYSDLNIAQIVINITHCNIEISITNNGKTLTSEEIQRMYQPFFRGKNSVLKKGFGLGLSIVKRVIEAHKGFIKYSSVMENENAFTVILPRKI
jgi:signal transduction histidine kinase